MKIMMGLSALMVSGVVLLGCGEATASQSKSLTMKGQLPLSDDSAASEAFKSKRYRNIMIVPPSGTARAQFESQLASAEKEFIRRGLTVISPAITGRVAIIDKEGDHKATATQLSDVERALIMAKETNADALLQIGVFEWRNPFRRYFIAGRMESTYKEVAQNEFDFSKDVSKKYFDGDYFKFTGRLIDVQSGEVMVSFDLWQGDLCNLPLDYTARFIDGGEGFVKSGDLFVKNKDGSYKTAPILKLVPASESFDIDDARWKHDAKDKSLSQIFSKVATVIAGT